MRARLYCVESNEVTFVQVNEKLTDINMSRDGELLPCRFFTVEIEEVHNSNWVFKHVSMVDGFPQLDECAMVVLDYGDGYGLADE
jgi:hypothetical protein